MKALNSFVRKCIHTHTIFIQFYNLLKPIYGSIPALVLGSAIILVFFPIDYTASDYMTKERMQIYSYIAYKCL